MELIGLNNPKDLYTLGFSLLAIILSCINFFQNRTVNRAKVLYDVIMESRIAEFNSVRIKLGKVFKEKQEVDLQDFREYCIFLNHIGLLLERNYIDIYPLCQAIGGSILFAWKVVGPSILARRKEPDGYKHYLFHFQYLVSRVMEYKDKVDEETESLIREASYKINSYDNFSKSYYKS